MPKISVLGSGSWGTALSVCLAENGNNVILWSHRDETVKELKKTRINTKYLPGIVLPENMEFTSDISICSNDIGRAHV